MCHRRGSDTNLLRRLRKMESDPDRGWIIRLRHYASRHGCIDGCFGCKRPFVVGIKEAGIHSLQKQHSLRSPQYTTANAPGDAVVSGSSFGCFGCRRSSRSATRGTDQGASELHDCNRRRLPHRQASFLDQRDSANSQGHRANRFPSPVDVCHERP